MLMIQETDKYKKCYRCQKLNTIRCSVTEDTDWSQMIYTGWCLDCEAPFSYRVRVDIVWDQEGRI